ncbi:MAG: SGNH/GDSL hydrolase family protein [Candidatus Firestonebacteria bacterium]
MKNTIISILLVFAACSGVFAIELDMFAETPGVHWYAVEEKLNTVLKQATYDCVSPETALRLTFLAANETDCVYTETVGRLTKLKMTGLVFWVKGDGSDNTGIAGITPFEGGRSFNMKNIGRGGCTVEFPLKEKSWKRYAFKWSDFKLGEGSLAGDRVKQLYFSVKTGSRAPVSYIVDKVEVSKKLEESAEDKELVKQLAEKKGIKPDPRPIVPAELVAGRNALAGARKKLAGGEPFSINCFGDSITAGTAVWRSKAPRAEKYFYHAVLKDMLEEAYKNDKITIVNSGIGGEQASHGLARLDRDILSKKPDLVIYEFGNNDSDIKQYTSNTEKICNRLDQAKIPVIVMGSTVFAGSDDKKDNFIRWQKDFAEKRSYGFMNIRDAILLRGDGFIGDYLADDVHPSYVGHRIYAEMLFELLKP